MLAMCVLPAPICVPCCAAAKSSSSKKKKDKKKDMSSLFAALEEDGAAPEAAPGERECADRFRISGIRSQDTLYPCHGALRLLFCPPEAGEEDEEAAAAASATPPS
jgi:hypothetical protein